LHFCQLPELAELDLCAAVRSRGSQLCAVLGEPFAELEAQAARAARVGKGDDGLQDDKECKEQQQ
jgi:hypothetical protein